MKEKLEKKRGIELKHYFIVGIREDSVIEESDDIIVGNFSDTYSNLSSKTKAAYEYFTLCENKEEHGASTLVIHDDDTWVGVDKIVQLFGSSGPPPNQLFGNEHRGIVVMNDWMEEKGFTVEDKMWKHEFWPNYIAGPCVIMSSKAALKIGASASFVEQIPKIPVEDAVFTGILRVKNCLEIGTLNYFSFGKSP